MTALSTLLALDPKEALVKMFNEANGTDYRPSGFTFGTPRVVTGNTTQVAMVGRPPANVFDVNVANASYLLTYERIPLDTYLAGVLDGYQVTLPASTQNVLNEITSRMGQAFYLDDIVLEEITVAGYPTYALTAKPESLRFIGSIALSLMTAQDYQSLFNLNQIRSVDDPSIVPFALNDSIPLVNGSDYTSQIDALDSGDRGQDSIALQQLFNGAVGLPPSMTGATWASSATPGYWNLYNATVVETDLDEPSVNPAIPHLAKALTVSLDGTYCTNFTSGTVTIPYHGIDPNTEGFVDTPRITHGKSLSLSNGSSQGAWLNSLAIGDSITSIPGGSIGLEAPWPWVADGINASPGNLYNAVVAYNGQVRETDLPSASEGLDRLIVLTLSGQNNVWMGDYPIYYQGPMTMRLVHFDTTVASEVNESITPAVGSAPYTYDLDGTTLPDGLSITDTVGAITGVPTTPQDGAFRIGITDSLGNREVFNLTYRIRAAPLTLTLTGTLPSATQNATYVAYLDIGGGQTPYGTPTAVNGNLPPSIALTVIHQTVQLLGIWPKDGTFLFTLSLSSADGQSVTASYAVNVAPEAM